MAEAKSINNVRLVFNCATCGALLSVDNHEQMGCDCPNCGASYDLNGEINLIRYGMGRPPSLWKSNGWDGKTTA